MLDQDAYERLDQVLAYAGNDLCKVVNGVKVALKGVRDRARYTHLFYVLSSTARSRIRKMREEVKEQKPSISPETYLDAYRHERELVRDIPQHDL